MSTINIDLAADTILNVMIGQQDENEVREVVFDFSGWYTAYGSGTISLAIQRPKDEWPYEGTLTVDSTNHKATWEISETDTAYAGTGQIQLSYKVGDAKKKSVVYRFTCHKSLGALGSVVTPVQIQTFIDEVEEELQTMDGRLDDMDDQIADVKADLSDLQAEIEGGGSGLTADLKAALDQLAQKVAYIDEDGQTYYDALHAALYPPANLTRISCVYTQSGTVYDTDSLDSLKSDLVVTAHFDNGTTQTVTTYALSGTLAEGTSTITVSYGRKTTTFTVEVTASRLPAGYTAYDYITIVAASKANIKNRGIKTDIQLSPTYQLETKVKYPSGQTHTESTCLMGTRTSQSGVKQFGLFVKPSENKLGYWFGGTDSTTTIPIVADSVNTIKVKPVGKSTDYPNNAVIEVDGTEYSTGSTQGSGTWSNWFGLMQYQISATALNGYDTWSSLIQQGEIIIKDYLNNILYDFIPASNGTIYGFYEAVNDIFYYDETYFAEYACGNWE